MFRGPARPDRAALCGASRRKKIRYRTLKDAKVARGFRAVPGADLRVYKCPSCHGYHLTSQPLRTPNSTRWVPAAG